MRFHKNRRFLFIITISLLIYLYSRSSGQTDKITNKQNEKRSLKKIECYRHIDIGNSTSLPKHAECTQKDWVRITDDGTLQYNEEILKQLNIQIENCTYSTVSWFENDFNYKETDPIKISNNQKLDSNSEGCFYGL